MSVAVAGRGRLALETRPLLVAVVGPAGAGKSTLLERLPASGLPCHELRLWGQPLAYLFLSACALVPTALLALLAGRRLRRAELEQMTRIGAMRRTVLRAMRQGHRLILVDEGTVFGVAWLDVFFQRNGDPGWGRWRARSLAEWAAMLDGIIIVDAADHVLARRIRTRDKAHMVKDGSNLEIFRFTARFRDAFDKAIAELTRLDTTTVVHVRTDEGTEAEGVLRMKAAIEEIRRGR